MTNFKTTKRALVSSVLALVMCFSMLLGTTFAWFTDSVTSSGNIIQTGTLEVEMHWADGTKDPAAEDTAWTDASEGAIFSNDKWEPGYTDAKHIKVANEGTLALKYQLSIVPTGTVSDLANVIDVYLVEGGAQVTSRTALSDDDYYGTLADLINNGISSGSLEAGEDSLVTIVLKMRESAGNEYQDLSIGSFSVQLLATQMTAEKDSFGSDYDADAEYVIEVATVDALKIALANVHDGDVIKLTADMTFTGDNCYVLNGYNEGIYYEGDKSFTIDLNGQTITNDSAINNDSVINDYLMLFKNCGEKANTITLKNGKIEAKSTPYSAVCTSGGSTQQITINLEDVEVSNTRTDGYGDVVRVRGGAVANVNEGAVITGEGVYVTLYSVNATVNIYDGAEIYMNETTSYVGSVVGASNGGTVNAYGGYGKGTQGCFIAMTTGGTINVEGGEWIADCNGTGNDGNYSVLIAQNSTYETYWASKSIINVTGGTFSGKYNCYGEAAGDSVIDISGGNFTSDPSAYVAQGYEVTESNGTYTVSMKEHTVSSADELAAAIAEGGKVTLTQDIEVTSTLNVVADTVIDLNGKTVTNNSGAVITINGGTLVLNDNGTDGAIIAGSTSDNNDDKAAILFGADGGKFVMEGGTLKSTKYAVRSYNISSSEIVINGGKIEAESYGVYDNSGSVTINGGEINSNFYGIAAYGTFIMNGGKITAPCAYLSQGTYDDTVAVINGGELIGTVYNGIYWPSAGSLTINGGSITGVNGVHVRSGSLSITGGTITGTGENDTALTVENIGGNSGYQAITSVSVTGGTFASVSGSAVTSVPDTTGSNPNAVAVTGFITGGTYSSDVSDLVAEGYAATESNGVWTVDAK